MDWSYSELDLEAEIEATFAGQHDAGHTGRTLRAYFQKSGVPGSLSCSYKDHQWLFEAGDISITQMWLLSYTKYLTATFRVEVIFRNFKD